jgi:hypothetical protein
VRDKTTENPWKYVMDRVAGILAKSASVDLVTALENLEIPPDSKLGDVATTISFALQRRGRRTQQRLLLKSQKSLRVQSRKTH